MLVHELFVWYLPKFHPKKNAYSNAASFNHQFIMKDKTDSKCWNCNIRLCLWPKQLKWSELVVNSLKKNYGFQPIFHIWFGLLANFIVAVVNLLFRFCSATKFHDTLNVQAQGYAHKKKRGIVFYRSIFLCDFENWNHKI